MLIGNSSYPYLGPFSDSVVFEPGDLVIENEVLYICTKKTNPGEIPGVSTSWSIYSVPEDALALDESHAMAYPNRPISAHVALILMNRRLKGFAGNGQLELIPFDNLNDIDYQSHYFIKGKSNADLLNFPAGMDILTDATYILKTYNANGTLFQEFYSLTHPELHGHFSVAYRYRLNGVWVGWLNLPYSTMNSVAQQNISTLAARYSNKIAELEAAISKCSLNLEEYEVPVTSSSSLEFPELTASYRVGITNGSANFEMIVTKESIAMDATLWNPLDLVTSLTSGILNVSSPGAIVSCYRINLF